VIKDVRKKELKDRIVKQAISSVRRNHKVDEVSLLSLSKELEVDFSEVTKYYTSMEDIFFEQQKKNWKKTYRNLNKNIKKAKTPGDFKNIFDSFLDDFVNDLSPDADLHWEVCSFMPNCLDFREKNKKVLATKIKTVIKKGWPGKTDDVLKRQTDLFILSFYGFIDHIVHLPKGERKKILKDFRNMLNLHLQDRLFF
tara:strand:+ start:1037 stop:1627 length:591 start_codon:yes stop_codon:yes gene_type:complete